MADSRDDFIIAIRYALLKKSAKQKFSLFFLIVLSVLIIFLDKLSISVVQTTRAVLNDFVYEIAIVASAPVKLVTYITHKGKDHLNIVEKNKILQNEIDTLKSTRNESLFLKTENKSLKQALNLNDTSIYEENALIAARVILDQESPYLKSLLINKGKKSGIIKGMTVFSKSYLIGTIIESNYLTSRVLLATDLNSKLPVMLQDSGVNAILTGSGKQRDLVLEYLPDEFVLEPNKIIFSSGRGGFLEPGLQVAETYLNEKDKIAIRPLADPQQALIVHITRGQINK